MIRAEGTILIARSPRQVLEYVLDLDRYRLADTKITRVSHPPSLGPADTDGRARYRGRLRGVPTPSQWQTVHLDPWRRLELRTEPGQWTAALATFHGGFSCEESDGGTLVTHFEAFDFRPPGRWLADPYLRSWLQRELTEAELPRLKELIEST